MRHTQHFNRLSDRMMVCPCCGKGELSVATLIVLEVVRVHFGVPVTITSACRCPEYNALERISGGYKSRHLTAHPDTSGNTLVWTDRETDAVDITVQGIEPQVVYHFLYTLPYANLLGLGKYNTFTHVDTRGFAARW